MWKSIEQSISGVLGEEFAVLDSRSIGGGCINETVHLAGERRSYFVKSNTPDRLPMFEAESAGLIAIRATGTVSAPEPIVSGTDSRQSWLVLEFLSLASNRPSAGSAQLGEQLSAMHRCGAEAFGWHRDNTLGLTPQPNNWTGDWITFLQRQRIGFQLELAKAAGLPAQTVDFALELNEALPCLYSNYQPLPSLLHGDLWGGNWAVTTASEPVIFDPAVYYGDREADIAMTEMFGGFDNAFYEAYEAAWPLDPGYKVRRDLHKLYHVLNHFNLFGDAYADQARALIERLTAELK